MRRLIVFVCAASLVLTACGEQQLGRRILECDGPTQSLGTSIVLTAQAVPGTEYIPCVEALRPGWHFNNVEARSGQAYFTIDSDRMGLAFLRVTLLPSCDVGSAVEAPSDEGGVTHWIDVTEEETEVAIVVIPVAARHHNYATLVVARLMSESMRGRGVVATLDESDRSISEKVAAAHASGQEVIIIDDAEVDTETVSLRLIGHDEEAGLEFEAAVEEIEDDVEEPAYQARWFYTFDDGCVRYDIDAEGEGAQTVRFDIARAIGLYPMEDLYELARDAGYKVFE